MDALRSPLTSFTSCVIPHFSPRAQRDPTFSRPAAGGRVLSAFDFAIYGQTIFDTIRMFIKFIIQVGLIDRKINWWTRINIYPERSLEETNRHRLDGGLYSKLLQIAEILLQILRKFNFLFYIYFLGKASIKNPSSYYY